MDKPDWKGAPQWASYLAMNENGDWFWYEHSPIARFGIWWKHREGRKELAQYGPKRWDETLEERKHE